MPPATAAGVAEYVAEVARELADLAREADRPALAAVLDLDEFMRTQWPASPSALGPESEGLRFGGSAAGTERPCLRTWTRYGRRGSRIRDIPS